ARPNDFVGLKLEIAGSELTNPQAAEVFSRVLGKRVKFQKLPLFMVRLVLGKEIHQMFKWFNEAGVKADIPALRAKYPEVHLQTLEEWLRNEGWHKRARHVRALKVVSPLGRIEGSGVGLDRRTWTWGSSIRARFRKQSQNQAGTGASSTPST